ncbi:MAG: sigma 54-interacting transcriptional regulator, partial [Ginsengibacter sp.]
LAKELKEQNIAFVYLSANSNQKILEEAKATEPYGFLVKPFREKDLLVMLDIAFYRHENSLESRWRKELLLQKELHDIQKSNDDIQTKLLQLAKALQHYILFDFISFKFKTHVSNEYTSLSFLRIGFEEYQKIGINELAVISGIKEDRLVQSFEHTPVDYLPFYKNDKDFTNSYTQNAMMKIYADSMDVSSELLFPVITSDGRINSMAFFRKSSDGFASEQLSFLSKMQLPLASVFEGLPEQVMSPSSKGIVNTSLARNSIQPQFAGIIGSSSSLLNVLDLSAQVAIVDTSVLLLGESGTGKEKIASCIHELSPRKNKPFIKINCSALPPALIESELFGHEKGAFTNAMEKHIGKFELADTGTIFLDEIGDMPVELQVKLLRVLQEREIERIGGKHPIKVDVRVIAATNCNLQHEMAQGKFRLDLYYRLNVFPITMPPLRERKEDIKELCVFFSQRFCKKFNKPYNGISYQMLQQLNAYDFPGNIRELENIIEQAVILNDGKIELTLRQTLSSNTDSNSNNSFQASLQNNAAKTLDDIKREQRKSEIDYIISVLNKTHGRIRGKDGAAELLNQKPTTLESRIAKLGIKKEDFQ